MEAQRYPVEVKMIGMMQKEKTKMLITSVLWSDQNEIIVYRSCEDFKQMHKQMKKAFPPANPMKKSDRVIPKFKNKNMKRGANKMGTSNSVMCLKFLEKYCSELLSCDARLSQSPELIQFFHPKDHDLQPDFAKNSVVIMLPETTVEGLSSKPDVNVTKPFVTETYRCVGTYETKDTKNRAFKVATDEQVDVLIKDKGGWWLVENADKRLAWFPAPYLEKIEDDVDENDGLENDGKKALYCAVKMYKASNGDEVSLEMGSVVEVLQKSDHGWWLVRNNDKAGYVPVMYLQPYNNPLERLAALQHDKHSSSLNRTLLHLPNPSLARVPQKRSRSQGNILQPYSLHPSSANQLHPANKHKSCSLNTLPQPEHCPEPSPKPRPPPHSDTVSTLAQQAPTIMVVDLDSRESNLAGSSFDSQDSDDSNDSVGCVSSSCCSSSLNLSPSYMEETLRLSQTPPPFVTDRLSSDSNGSMVTKGNITASRSDPDLFRRPTTPKVPPRPRAHEILTRCTTVTRKNISKAKLCSSSHPICSLDY